MEEHDGAIELGEGLEGAVGEFSELVEVSNYWKLPWRGRKIFPGGGGSGSVPNVEEEEEEEDEGN